MKLERSSFLVVCACAGLAWAAPQFHGLGRVNATDTYTLPTAVSGDGATVVGFSGNYDPSGSSGAAFTWTADEGMTVLPAGENGYPLNLSVDGSVIVGTTYFLDAQIVPRGAGAVRWTNGTRSDLIPVSTWDVAATDVTADGQTVVGHELWAGGATRKPAWKWTAEGGKVSLPDLSTATGISADGSVIVGSLEFHGARVLRNGEPIDLGEPTIRADAVSADGNVVVGIARSATMYMEPFRWTEEGGLVCLGGPGTWNGPDDQSRMLAVDADGSTFVGWAVHPESTSWQEAAIIWDEAHGSRFLQDVLTDQYGLDLTGWQLLGAHGISDDGLTIVGHGKNPEGRSEGWVVHLPEPASAWLLMAVAVLTPWKPRRARSRT